MPRAASARAAGARVNLQLHRQDPADWPALAEPIHAWNRRADGGVHCLHAEAGEDVAAQAAELASLPTGEAMFWIVGRAGTAVGLVGCEFDPALRRAWIRGPLVAEPPLLDALLPLVTPTLDAALPGITQFDAFPAADAAALNRWYAAAGYERQLLHRVLRAPVGAAPSMPQQVRRAVPADLTPAFALHQTLFPQSYLGRADFARALGAEDRALFVIDDPAAGSDTGYVHVQDGDTERDVYVDYLGVAPAWRGRGYGRHLLAAAAAWAAQRGRSHVALTVREDRRSAIDLYARAGFAQVSAGRHWRRIRGGTQSRT